MTFVYKIARTKQEFNQIHRLNYKTFVEEIPQHDKNEEKMLVDKFHDQNTYLICVKDSKVVGMIAVRAKRPFSLDYKLHNLDEQLPVKPNKPCEIRLLSVEEEYRSNGRIFFGLAQLMSNFCLKEGYDVALISGTTRQEKLYRQLGFIPFASLTGTEEASFWPMYLTKQTFDESLAGRILKEPVSFLPGPIKIHENVYAGLKQEPVSHRSNEFLLKMRSVREKLCSMTNSKHVEVLVGSGTLANDVIAAQLAVIGGKGLILNNGEFGSRLIDHANRAGLSFKKVEKDWGVPITETEIKKELGTGHYTWLWAVHSETSTGMLTNIQNLKEICLSNKVNLCLDCISTVGAVKLDLQGVYFASGVSGKALGGYTGLSFVFHNHDIRPNPSIPRYLDLGMYANHDSIPYSHSSNMLEALYEALKKYENDDCYQKIKERYKMIREYIEGLGLQILTPPEYSSPAIMTILLPEHVSSKDFGDDMALQGYYLHYESHYLQEKKWIQISCLSSHEEKQILKMLRTFELLLNQYEIAGEPSV
ncbi:aminotransferase class V-fold PLP-dependent enzyme [Fredinandcohnia sp. QZ13]|uniref:aminotransferase class V-fold PLP-dependent enzyme n=1 Tax=Fredinandcohnia sp. QZ13 TaxID=3073144 RepID=UPI0028535947|nr:aminotransferase class V-fold PLP-dependent enzyme [Fredinandcohnia sp. QZ13]MDR4889354.1 aminotransferase class V-fold PLP-dependent enzyme [Fredinandcohnia sp. QZ13]